MFVLLALVNAVAGYCFYQWRGSLSLVKTHASRRAKKHSLQKLLWGFLTVTTFPGFLMLWIAIAWKGELLIVNLAAISLLAFALGGLCNVPFTMRSFRKEWPEALDADHEQPRQAA